MIKKNHKILLFLLSIIFVLSAFNSTEALTVTLTSPANNATVSSTTPTFAFKVAEFNESAGVTCNLFIDGSNHGTKDIFGDGTFRVKSDQKLSNGSTHMWNIDCDGVSGAAAWVFHVREGNLWDGIDDTVKIMSIFLITGLGFEDEGNEEQGFVRLVLFFMIFGTLLLAVRKVLFRFEDSRSMKAVSIVFALGAAFLAVKYTPGRFIETLLEQITAYMSIISVVGPAAVVLYLMYAITDNSYVRGGGMILAGIVFPSENLIDLEIPAAWLTKILLVVLGIIFMIHGAHKAGHIKGGDVKRAGKFTVRKGKDTIKLFRNLKKQRKLEIKEDQEIRDLEIKGKEVIRRSRELRRQLAKPGGMSKKEFKSKSKNIEKLLEKEQSTAKKALKNFVLELRRVRTENGLVNDAMNKDAREIKILQTDYRALRNAIKHKHNLDAIRKEDRKEFKELQDIHGEINALNHELLAEYNEFKKIYKIITTLASRAKKAFASERPVEISNFLHQLERYSAYLEGLEKKVENLEAHREKLKSKIDRSTELIRKLTRREKKQEKVVQKEATQAEKGDGKNIGLKVTGAK